MLNILSIFIMKKNLLLFAIIALLCSACTQNAPDENPLEQYIGKYSLSLIMGENEFYMYDDNTHKLLTTTKPPVNSYSNKELKIWATDENDKKNGISNELFIAGGEIMSLADVKSSKLIIQSHGGDYYSQGILYEYTYSHEPVKIVNNCMEWKCTFKMKAKSGSNSATGEYIYTYKAIKK